nr:MAG TPA: hypothetical protein [Caudoviricetes sp.]
MHLPIKIIKLTSFYHENPVDLSINTISYNSVRYRSFWGRHSLNNA